MKIRFKILLPFIAILLLVAGTHAIAQNITDHELKKSATPIANSLSYITKLQPVSYQFNRTAYKQLNLPGGTHYGFIADDLKQVLPGAITSDSKWFTAGKNNQRVLTFNKVDVDELVPLLVGAIKEQQTEIEKLKIEIQQLKSRK